MKGGKRRTVAAQAGPAAPPPPQLAQAFASFKSGNLDEAERGYAALVASHPRLAVAHNHLGLIAKARGQVERAEALLRRAVELDPGDISGSVNLGNLLSGLGRHAEAEPLYTRALELSPESEDCLINMGWTRYNRGDAAGALDFYRRVLAKHPSSPRALNGRGLCLTKLGRTDEAEAAYRRALTADPRFTGAYNNLGVLLRKLGRYDEACDVYRRVLEIDPRLVEALNNLGCALQEMGRPVEAMASLHAALALSPSYADAMGNLGNAHLAALELDQALVAYRRAEALGPAKPDLGLNKAFVHLLRGDFAAGWMEYEARLALPELVERFRSTDLPRWDGRPIERGRLLVLDEQGLGDTIQFLRFVPTAAARVAGGVALHVPSSLKRLVPTWPGLDLIEEGQRPADCVAWTPLLSLPQMLGVGAEAFSMPKPYLSIPAGVAARWTQRIGADGLKVGLVWSGSPGHRRDRERSIPSAMLAPLFRIAGVRFFSLQKVHPPGSLEQLSTFGEIADLSANLTDLAETGAASLAMDVIVSVDTSVAHLAGALGAKVLTLIPYSPDWRWLLGRTDSPWYPSMTLVRQSAPNDWRGVIERTGAMLNGA